jgi:hypothetical protein
MGLYALFVKQKSTYVPYIIIHYRIYNHAVIGVVIPLQKTAHAFYHCATMGSLLYTCPPFPDIEDPMAAASSLTSRSQDGWGLGRPSDLLPLAGSSLHCIVALLLFRPQVESSLSIHALHDCAKASELVMACRVRNEY